MVVPSVIYFDIAAVVIMVVTLLSLLLRRMTRGSTNRVYLTCMVLVTLTASVRLVGELCDLAAMSQLVQAGLQAGLADAGHSSGARDVLTLLYYALSSLIAPMFLVLIATISSTTHHLNSNNFVRVCLWGPMLAILLLVLTNPLHHLVYAYVQDVRQFGPLMAAVYASSVYYSLIGIGWLMRWREVLTKLEFVTLLAIYPIGLVSILVQLASPVFQVEMFVTSVVMMLISVFVIRPEARVDSLIAAASLPAYREKCRRAFLTGKRLCLVYLEIVNLEQLRLLVGKDELQDIVHEVSANLSSRLERDDTLYYLRNGAFCISSRNLDIGHALQIAHQAHDEGREKSTGNDDRMPQAQLRTCVVRIPEDVSDNDTLKAFVRRFSHLAPQSCVTTFQELAQREGFGLEMALSDIVARAIDQHSFSVHYQPIWSLADGRFRSAEALVRLEDATFGQVPPTMFIPEAEQNGSIDEIGAILLEKICAFLGRIDYEALGLDYVEANLSAEQCVRSGFADELIGLMRAHNVDPARLNLEITETSASYSQEIIDENLRKLSKAGVAFSLDDYGTGYSNALRLICLPFKIVKLDKSLVDHIDDPAVRTVLADTIAMLKSIGKQTLAEGVETQAQAEALAAMGVDFIQGYYYAMPLPEDEFLAFLAERRS